MCNSREDGVKLPSSGKGTGARLGATRSTKAPSNWLLLLLPIPERLTTSLADGENALLSTISLRTSRKNSHSSCKPQSTDETWNGHLTRFQLYWRLSGSEVRRSPLPEIRKPNRNLVTRSFPRSSVDRGLKGKKYSRGDFPGSSPPSGHTAWVVFHDSTTLASGSGRRAVGCGSCRP